MTRVPVTIRRDRTIPTYVYAQVLRPRIITIRPDVVLSRSLIAHELAHVLQWERHGWVFPVRYVAAWAAAGFSYHRSAFEAEARAAERDPVMLTWADDVLRQSKPG